MFIRNLAYEASAGSGKTFMLVVRYLSLLFQGADASKILALTFTNKAASEMSERIIETLEELEHRGELDEIIAVTELSKEELLAKRAAVLHHFLDAHTKIMTIDSFFTQILRKFSLYSSLMPDFTTHAAQHELKLLERFLQEVSVSGNKELLIMLALESDKRFSGIFTLLEEFYAKQEELSHLHFSRVSTFEYIQEAMAAVGEIEKIVSSCKGASATLKKQVTCKSFEELLSRTWIEKETLEYWVFKKCFTREMDQQLTRIQDAVKGYHKAKEQNFFYAMQTLVSLYKKAKKALYQEESELSFTDVTQLVYTILHQLNESEFLYFRLDAHIEHILLDEFQDTSILQYKILQPLIGEITSGEGVSQDGSFFFVGDVKQSIYRFRGGVSALFDVVAKQNNTEVKKLRINYRSKEEVVEFVNRTFLPLMKNYTPQKVKKGGEGGYVEVAQEENLLEEMLKRVQRLLKSGAHPDSIAILCATNGDGEEVKKILQEHNIDVVTETTTLLINQKGVEALIEYLKYVYFKAPLFQENFFALLGRRVDIEPVDIKKRSLYEIVKKAIEKYQLFDGDFNTLRFLNLIESFGDIEALLFEYERIQESAASSEIHGVRVLTIHKSKGLEYEHVIVLDRLKKAPNSSRTIIYEYDGITLQNVYLRTANRDALDNNYKTALLKEKSLVKEDTLNAFYVAFTRAKRNLFIIQKKEKSSFELLNLPLGSWGALDLETLHVSEKKAYKPFVYEELYYGTQSDILSLEKQQEEDLEAISFGLAVHYMLEMMAGFDESSVALAKDMMLNKYGFELSDEMVEEIEKRIKSLVGYKPFQTLLQGAKISKEQPLKYKNNLRYIDLLLELEDGSFVVIDYKTSQNFASKHKAQVRSYIKAVQEITSKEVKGYLCYLLEDGITLIQV